MIVDYPCAHEILVVPPGMRKPRPFVVSRPIRLEIPERTSDDAPVVVSGPFHDGAGIQPAVFRKMGDDWYVDEPSVPSRESVERKPAVLALVPDMEKFRYRSRISRGEEVVAEGPVGFVGSARNMPKGREISPPGYDPTDGRRAAIEAGVADLVVVDGRLHRRTREPGLALTADGRIYLTTRSMRDVGGTRLRVDHLDEAMTIAAERRAIMRERGIDPNPVEREIDVVSADAFEWDPYPEAAASMADLVLFSMKDRTEKASVSWFMAYSELRDAVSGKHPRSLPTSSPDEIYELAAVALRENLPITPFEWDRRHLLGQCVERLVGTPCIERIVDDFGDEIRELGVWVPGSIASPRRIEDDAMPFPGD